MKRSKRERKISKVMGEFKDGSLKSGGSGRKVTNPKQAIAIALSEAEGMNQGGMMYNQIMQRPMFQTPQQRQGMGIMAGVAPVRGYAEGDLVSDDFFSLEQTEAGSGMNLRDLTNFIFDPSDPVDYATLGLIAFPPALIAARLAKMGVKGAKAAEQVQKVVKLQEAMPSKLGGGSSGAKSGLQVQMAALPAALMEEDIAMADEMPTAQEASTERSSTSIEDVIDIPNVYEMIEGYSGGGIASLPVIEMRLGGEVIKGIFDFVTTYGSRGLEALSEGVKRQLSKGQADQLVDQAKKADKVLGEAGAETVEQGQRLVLKKPDGELIETPIGKIPKAPEPPPPAKVADDAAGATKKSDKKADKKADKEEGEAAAKRRPIRTIGKAGAVGAAGLGATDLALGTNFLSAGLEKIGDTYGAVRDDVAATLEMPEIDALRQRANPSESPFYTGERVELTESVMEQVDLNKDGKISDEERKAIKEKADKAVAAQQKPDTGTGTGTPKPEATGIMKFLFGKDGIGGDPGAVGKSMEYLADPRTRYALARAAESRPGIVDRNFFTDFTLGQAEYDQLQSKDETALMQNYEFLKAAGKSDDEIFNLLLSKDTESDLMDTYRDAVLTLYKEADENPNNTGVDRDDLLKQAQMRAAQIVFGTQSSAPQDREVVQTVELE